MRRLGDAARLPALQTDDEDLRLALMPGGDKGEPRTVGRPGRLGVGCISARELSRGSVLKIAEPDRALASAVGLGETCDRVGHGPAVGRELRIGDLTKLPEVVESERAGVGHEFSLYSLGVARRPRISRAWAGVAISRFSSRAMRTARSTASPFPVNFRPRL